jgi:hypothetical protein
VIDAETRTMEITKLDGTRVSFDPPSPSRCRIDRETIALPPYNGASHCERQT